MAGECIDLSIVPSYESESHDFVRLENLAAGWFALINLRRKVGFAFRFDAALFPVVGYWQLFGGGPDYPWYKQHFLAALEPACGLPSLREAVEHGTALELEGGEMIETTIEATAFDGLDEVHSVEIGGVVL
jgi:hypothetical protein